MRMSAVSARMSSVSARKTKDLVEASCVSRARCFWRAASVASAAAAGTSDARMALFVARALRIRWCFNRVFSASIGSDAVDSDITEEASASASETTGESADADAGSDSGTGTGSGAGVPVMELALVFSCRGHALVLQHGTACPQYSRRAAGVEGMCREGGGVASPSRNISLNPGECVIGGSPSA